MLPAPVFELLRSQWGLAARYQVRELEPSESVRRCIYRSPDLEPVTARVLRHRAVPPSREQAVMATVLDAGRDAQLWGKSGATLFGFDRHRLLPAHVAVPRRRQLPMSGGQLHVISDLDPRDRTSHLDIPVARPGVVVLWLAGAWTHRFGHEIALERAAVTLDQAWRQRLIDGRYIHDLAARSGGRGRSGIVVFRQLLDVRPPDYQPAGSRLEERFEALVSPAVARRLQRQVTVDAGPILRTVDFRVEGRALVVEVNGEAWHTSLTDRAADDERYARFLELGLSVVVFWEHDIWHDGSTVRRAMDRIVSKPDREPTLHRPTPAPWQT